MQKRRFLTILAKAHPSRPGVVHLSGGAHLSGGPIPIAKIEIGQKDRTTLHNRPAADADGPPAEARRAACAGVPLAGGRVAGAVRHGAGRKKLRCEKTRRGRSFSFVCVFISDSRRVAREVYIFHLSRAIWGPAPRPLHKG